ncbi:MAG: sigma 54-interacting transcriptional regulator [Methylococcales bacterium]|nr:sigma 54-interacting transcriptional regulator [Methylococcales bacterium]
MNPSLDYLTNNAAWLAQDSQTLLFKLLALCGNASIYLVDGEQQVMYWGDGMVRLTGLPAEDMLGQTCPAPYRIIATDGEQAQSLMVAGHQVNKTARQLHHNNGVFWGAIGILELATEAVKDLDETNKSDPRNQNFHGLLSRSPAMRHIFQIIENAAQTEATVLVRGESGAGKELVAKAIHKLSARQKAPFLAINCAALSSNLLESELFGHVRGAFTGAIKDHQGLFQRAHGGTLFLDEVAELPLELQAKLLRVLQERNYIPVGGDRSIAVDVRIVAATHRSLREEVKNGRFREDLMYRLRVVPIFIPPLRDRREDIPLLVWHFINRHNNENFRRIDKIDPLAMRTLLDYAWPGNIRELHNVVEYAFAVGRGTTLRPSDLPPEFRETQPPATPSTIPAAPVLPVDQSAAICLALEQHQGNITAAANAVGMSRATFWRKRKQYGL